jgi:uncharacterized protein (DUF1330 family)
MCLVIFQIVLAGQLVGLHELDDGAYDDCRAAMRPILDRFGGGFRYDFKIAEVLQSESTEPINRVFTIHFADETSKDAFFAHPDYQVIRERHFEHSVTNTVVISEYRQ